jgi:hypothetical protein
MTIILRISWVNKIGDFLNYHKPSVIARKKEKGGVSAG